MEERQKKVRKQIQERQEKVEKQRKSIAGMVTISIVVACMIISLLLQRKEINDSIKSYSARYEMLQDSIEEEKEHVKEIEKLKEIIIGIRNLRASSNVHPSKKTELIFVTTKYKDLINQSEGVLKKLGYSENIKVQENKEGIAQNALSIITDGIELYIPFEELVDIEEERKRMEEEKKKVIAEIERASKMLSNPGFVNKAPEAKVNEEKAKLEKYQNMLKNLEERLK